MKKNIILGTLKIIFSVVFVLAAISCSNIIDEQNKNSTVEESTQNPSGDAITQTPSTDSKLARLSVSVQDAPFEDEEISARTIRPNVNSFKYSLDAVDTTTNESADGFPKNWDSYSAMKKGTLEIETGTYNFTLTIKDSSDNIICASTIPNKEVGSGDNFLVFTIEESGTGNLKLTISIPKYWDIASAEVSLYANLSSTTPIDDTTQTFTVNNTDDEYKANYEIASLPVGSYIVKCKFTDSDGNEVSKGYMDAVQIRQNFPSIGSIGLYSSEDVRFNKSDYALVIKPGDTLNLFELTISELSSDNIKFKTNNSAFTISDDGILTSSSSYTVSSSPEVVDLKIISKKTGKASALKILVDDDLILSQAEYRKLCPLLDSSKTYSTITSFTVPYGYIGTADTENDGEGTFFGSAKLNKVTFPETIESIGGNSFDSVSSLKTVNFPKGLKYIGFAAFYKTGITSLSLSNNVETIELSAFNSCQSLTSATLYDSSDTENPPKLKSIGIKVFSTCPNCKSITIPNSVESIGERAFYNWRSLTSITIPNSVESIGEMAFYYSDLTSITIPASVKNIDKNAFQNCTKLTSATFENKTGWKVYTSESYRTNDTSGTSINVDNTSTAATYLISTHAGKYWGRRD